MSKAYLDSFLKKVSNNPFYVLDTETTALKNGEIVQCAVVNSAGETLLDTLVKPTKSIPLQATKIHKITDAMVANAPSWSEVAPWVADLVTGRYVVIYNTSFDVPVLQSSDTHVGSSERNWHDKTAKEWLCAMRAYATFNGEWNDYRKSYAWKSLDQAANRFGVKVVNAHSALGDCQMTLGVVRGLIAAQDKAQS